jgi:hypothetical protein
VDAVKGQEANLLQEVVEVRASRETSGRKGWEKHLPVDVLESLCCTVLDFHAKPDHQLVGPQEVLCEGLLQVGHLARAGEPSANAAHQDRPNAA